MLPEPQLDGTSPKSRVLSTSTRSRRLIAPGSKEQTMTRQSDTDPDPGKAQGPLTPSKIVAVGVAAPEEPNKSAKTTQRMPPRGPTTDPGVAPPSETKPSPNKPLGIVVPGRDTEPGGPPPDAAAAKAPGAKNDSIDTLLDAITGSRGPGAKLAPTSGGAAAAVFGSTHQVKEGQDTS